MGVITTISDLSMATLHLTECTLATVEWMASKKSKPKGEYKRQAAIAQRGIDCIKSTGLSYSSHIRVSEVIENNLTVEEWATQCEDE